MNSILFIPLGREHIQIGQTGLSHSTTWDVQRHCNAEWELHFIGKGSCLVDLDQEHFMLTAGQAALIAPGVYHQARTASGDFERFTLGFIPPKGLLQKQLLERAKQSPVLIPDEPFNLIVDRIRDEYHRHNPYQSTSLTGLIYCLAAELARFLNLDPQARKTQQNRQETQLTQHIDTFFEQHFADSCAEEVLAGQLHVSRRHLIRILQKHYGLSFREKLIQARMDYAALLLRTTNKTVSHVASDVGYGSESSFFKIFRQNFGMTPGQYKKQFDKK